jgi:hypothetical protein
MSLQLLMRKMSVSRDLRASRGALLTAGNPGENGSGRPAPDSAMLDLVWLSSCVTVRGPKRWDDRWFGSLKRDSCNDINGVGRTLPPPAPPNPTVL